MADSSDSDDDERERARQQRALLKQRAGQASAQVRAQDAAQEEEDAGDLEERRMEQEQLALQLKAQEDLQRAALQVRMVMKMKTQAGFARSRLAARGANGRAAARAGVPDADGQPPAPVSTAEGQDRGTVVQQLAASDAVEAGAARAGPKPGKDAAAVSDEPLTSKTKLKLEALPLAMTEEDRLDLDVKEQQRLKATAAEEERRARELEEGARLKSRAMEKEDALNKSAGSVLEKAEAEACARQQAEIAKAEEIRRLLASQEIGQQQACSESAVWRTHMESKMDADRAELAELRAQKEAVGAAREEARRAAALQKRVEEEEEAARLKAAFEVEEERLRALAEETARKERENEMKARKKEEAERREREELAEAARKQAEVEREERERKRLAEQQRAREQEEREGRDRETEPDIASQGQELELRVVTEDTSRVGSGALRHASVGAARGRTGRDVRVEEEVREAIDFEADEVNSAEQARPGGEAGSSGLYEKEVGSTEEAKSDAESEAEDEAREGTALETRLGNDPKLANDGDGRDEVRNEVASGADLEECGNQAPSKQDAAPASGQAHEGQTPKAPETEAPGPGGRAGAAEQSSREGGLDEAEDAAQLKTTLEEVEATACLEVREREKSEEVKRGDWMQAEAARRAKEKSEKEEKRRAEEGRAREEENLRRQAAAARVKAAERQKRLERESLMLERAQLDAEIANLRQSWTANHVGREGNASTANVLMAAREALGEGAGVDASREQRGTAKTDLYRLLWGSEHATPKMQLDILKHRLRERGGRVQIQGVAGTRWSGPRAELRSAGKAGPGREGAAESGRPRRQRDAQSLSPRRHMPIRGDGWGAEAGVTHPGAPRRESSLSPYAMIPAILTPNGRRCQRMKRLVEMQKRAETVVVEAAHVAAPHRRTAKDGGSHGLPPVGQAKTIVRLAPRRGRDVALPHATLPSLPLTRRKSGA